MAIISVTCTRVVIDGALLLSGVCLYHLWLTLLFNVADLILFAVRLKVSLWFNEGAFQIFERCVNLTLPPHLFNILTTFLQTKLKYFNLCLNYCNNFQEYK